MFEIVLEGSREGCCRNNVVSLRHSVLHAASGDASYHLFPGIAEVEEVSIVPLHC